MMKFNANLFAAILNIISFNTGNSLEDVLRVLEQSSDESRVARLNHNCRIDGLPFCWDYHTGYGEDGETRVKVVSFPMVKISTGWRFILDIEENGSLYISEGKGTRRTAMRMSRLNDFSPSTRERVRKVVAYLCNCSVAGKVDAGELFAFYKQAANAEDETAYSVVSGDVQPSSLYKAFQVKGVPETRHIQYWSAFENPNPHDDALAEKPKKHIIMIKWHNNLERWYADFIFEGEAWGFTCLNDAGTYPIFDKSFKLDDIDEDTGKPDPDWIGNKLSPKLRSELEAAVESVSKQEGAKSGSWIVVNGGDCYRCWSQLPESDRIHIYVALYGTQYYDDIEELNFSPEGEECLFKNWHVEEDVID